MSSQNRDSAEKPQYPFVSLPIGSGWEVLFVDSDRPYREAVFSSRQEALAFCEVGNENWRIARHETQHLMERLRPPRRMLKRGTPGVLYNMATEDFFFLSAGLFFLWLVGC